LELRHHFWSPLPTLRQSPNFLVPYLMPCRIVGANLVIFLNNTSLFEWSVFKCCWKQKWHMFKRDSNTSSILYNHSRLNIVPSEKDHVTYVFIQEIGTHTLLIIVTCHTYPYFHLLRIKGFSLMQRELVVTPKWV
jgi:hypothetical protein